MALAFSPQANNNPLGIALISAIAVHLIIIQGIGFTTFYAPPAIPDKILDITLTRQAKPVEKVKDAEFLSTSNQQGGAQKQGYSAPATRPVPPTVKPKKKAIPVAQPKTGKAQPKKKKTAPITSKSKVKIKTKTEPRKPVPPKTRKLNISSLLEDTQLEIDRLTAELDQRSKAAAMKKKRKHISASTQEYKYAAYMDAWRRKVENIGNLNYPDEAKRKKLYGSLLLHVSVNANGTIEHIRIARSSGHKILDDSAVRIVRLAAPFAPFPASIRKEVDILDITRTWQFRSGNQLFAN